MYYLVRIFFSSIEFFTTVLLCLSLFRIYFRYSLHKVALIAIVMATVSVYVRDILDLINYAVLPVILSEIILITILFGLPFIFSFLVCVIGILATATIEGIVIYVGGHFNLFTETLLKVSLTQFIIYDLINALLLALIIIPLQKYKLGFHTTSNDALKGYNFLLSAILVVAIVAIQIELVSFKASAIHIFIPIILGIILLVGVYLAYRHNKKLWKNRRERLSKR
ncbi:hypothetical protein [Paenibacillus sp. OAS669]|uniref:hypothetical protein n=1 Tax=Paenibacillus sp. OAS669 TaxID=2663821 RepID=UPI00178B29C6|nr:hypothetical protein [Paenibacillus sp. OAS669]MBE1441153.1 hypothetical protein [Paenibacillus sp. OAS669]